MLLEEVVTSSGLSSKEATGNRAQDNVELQLCWDEISRLEEVDTG